MLEHLPDVYFVIAAPVVVSDNISRLLQYPNVLVLSDIAPIPDAVAYYVQQSDLLLDINYGGEVNQIISTFQSQGKPVLAFDNTQHGEQGQVSFAHDKPEEMVNWIKRYKGGKEVNDESDCSSSR